MISYVNDFSKFDQVYGIFNKDKNTYLRKNYIYKLKVNNSKSDTIEFKEKINKKNSKIEPKVNIHTLNKYSLDNLISFAEMENFKLIENILVSNARKCFGFLIFKKIM